MLGFLLIVAKTFFVLVLTFFLHQNFYLKICPMINHTSSSLHSPLQETPQIVEAPHPPQHFVGQFVFILVYVSTPLSLSRSLLLFDCKIHCKV
jgi:hypothetical protein